MIIANVHQAKSDLSKLLAAMAAGKDVVIAKAGVPFARIIRYQDFKKPRVPGLFKGRIWVSDDFNDEDPEINKMFYGE